MTSPFWTVLHLRLDAEVLQVSYGDLLWSIAFFTDPQWASLRAAPETLTLDALWRLAYHFGWDLSVELRKEEEECPLPCQS